MKNEKERKCLKCCHYRNKFCNKLNILIKEKDGLADECKLYKIKLKFKKYNNCQRRR